MVQTPRTLPAQSTPIFHSHSCVGDKLSRIRREWNNPKTRQDFMRQITTLVFDWDGTLADSASLGLAAFQKTFADLGVPFPQDVYEATYSPNWYSTYEARS